MGFATWIARKRWAANMSRAKAFRDGLGFAERQVFDRALRPPLKHEKGLVIGYPDALYRVTIDDLCRAMRAVTLKRLDGTLLSNGMRETPEDRV
jgi:hypothetical protein